MMSSFLATTIKTTLCGLPFSFSRSAKMCRTGLWFEATRAAICLSEQWPIPGKSPIKFAVGTGPIPGMDRAIRRASIGSVLANTPLARENERTCAADTWRASKPVSFRACHTAYSYPPVGSRAIMMPSGSPNHSAKTR